MARIRPCARQTDRHTKSAAPTVAGAGAAAGAADGACAADAGAGAAAGTGAGAGAGAGAVAGAGAAAIEVAVAQKTGSRQFWTQCRGLAICSHATRSFATSFSRVVRSNLLNQAQQKTHIIALRWTHLVYE